MVITLIIGFIKDCQIAFTLHNNTLILSSFSKIMRCIDLEFRLRKLVK